MKTGEEKDAFADDTAHAAGGLVENRGAGYGLHGSQIVGRAGHPRNVSRSRRAKGANIAIRVPVVLAPASTSIPLEHTMRQSTDFCPNTYWSRSTIRTSGDRRYFGSKPEQLAVGRVQGNAGAAGAGEEQRAVTETSSAPLLPANWG